MQIWEWTVETKIFGVKLQVQEIIGGETFGFVFVCHPDSSNRSDRQNIEIEGPQFGDKF